MTEFTKFADLPLSKLTQKGLKASNYIDLTDIQKQSIPPALRGTDILGAAKTGSGKTLAFLVPVLEKLVRNQWTSYDGLGALIITPTRELALQIFETLKKIGKHHGFSAGLIIGGRDWHYEKNRINNCNIIICTPGRLLHHMEQSPNFYCNNLKILVLDEADRCLDEGFQKDMNHIIEGLPTERQTLLFSATQTKSVQDLARLSLKDPLYVSVHEYAACTTPEALQQTYIICNLEDKMSMLWSFIKTHLKQKIIIFFSTCKQVKYVNEVLCAMRPGVSLLALHGRMPQERRVKVYESFHQKNHAVLLATDIAARGLDFPDVNWVVHMDCPENVNAYIHRAGRTARLKHGGESLLVLLPTEEKFVDQLKERKIPITMIKINPNKLQSPQRKLEALLARNQEFKAKAQRAFVAYIKSVFMEKNKEIFNVHALNTDSYARSLGLAIPPRIKCLEKHQRNLLRKKNEKAANNSDESSSDDESDAKDKPIDSYNTKNIFKDVHIDDKDDDFLFLKRKNVQLDDNLPKIDLAMDQIKPMRKSKLMKKAVRGKIDMNKKINFNEEGEEIDPVTAKALKVDKESAPGIDIEVAKTELKEADKEDREKFREKIKKKHKEEKLKLKAQKQKKQDIEEEKDEGQVSEEEDSADEESEYEPDLSWLPDPDKIYGPKKDSENESDNDSHSEPEKTEKQTSLHKKRKNVDKHDDNSPKLKKKKNKLESLTNDNLGAAEELALQLLRS